MQQEVTKVELGLCPAQLAEVNDPRVSATGTKYGGGVQVAVDRVENRIGPAIREMDASNQLAVDGAIIALDGTPNKAVLGGNATASVSAAVLQAGAASLGIPLYQHIGGVHACVLPVPGVISVLGSRRYGGGQRS